MKKLATIFILFVSQSICFAQTQDELNLEKYWKYRERLKTYFMKIGSDAGMSIPMSGRIPDWDSADIAGTSDFDVTTLEWRDATISLGYYFIVLATEYKLLNDAGQDTESTLIELYYALNALNRLDLKAETYHSEDQFDIPTSADLNGLFLRDDIPANFADNWQPETLPDGYPMPDGNATLRVDADAQGYDYGPYEDFNAQNVESLDQLVTIILGLRFVYELVDAPSIEIPELTAAAGTPVQKNLHYMAGQIVFRLLTYLNDMNQTPSNDKEWKILLPDGQLAPRGFDCSVASVPFCNFFDDLQSGLEGVLREPNHIQIEYKEDDLCDLISSISPGPLIPVHSGKDFLIDVMKRSIWYIVGTTTVGTILEVDIEAWECAHCIEGFPCFSPASSDEPVKGPLPVQISMNRIENLWEKLEENEYPVYVDSEGEICLIDLNTFTFDWNTGALPGGVVEFDPDALCFDLSGYKLNEDNVHLMLEESLIGDMWGISYTKFIADNSQMYHIPMMWNVLANPNSPTLDGVASQREFYRDIISGAPCEGPYAKTWANPATTADCAPNGWGGPNRLFMPDAGILGPLYPAPSVAGDKNYRGYYPGLDYMVYHNLYHLLWRNESDMPAYSKSGICNCVSEITDEIEISNTLTVTRYHEDYQALGIPIESYLSHNLLVEESTGILEVKNDLVICKSSPTVPTILTIASGARLEIFEGNTITVRSGNKIIIEEGGELVGGIGYNQCCGGNATLILEEDAELHVLGGTFTAYAGLRFEMKHGSKFIVEDAYIDFTNLSTGSSVSCDGGHWLITNTTYHKDNGAGYTALNFYNESIVTFTDCTVDARDTYFNLSDNSFLTFGDCDVSFLDGGISGDYASFIDLQNSTVSLNHSIVQCIYGSSLNQYLSDIICFNNSSMTFGYLFPESEENNHYYYSGGIITLEGSESNITFKKGELHIAAGATFAPTHPNAQSGYIQFRGIDDAELVTGYQSKLKLVGDGPTDVMLVINDWAELQNANYKMGSIELENCAVDLTNNGRLWTDMNLKGTNVNFVDNNTNTTNQTVGGEVQVWYATTCFLENCNFNQVRLHSRYTYTVGTGTSFSGIRSGFRAMDGRYKLDLCSFDACHLESNSLHNASYIRKCNFNAPAYIGNGFIQPACVYDESLVELYVSETNFTNARQALVKQGGRLSVRCSNFTNINGYAITANDAALNMSSAGAGGYNNFVDVESCIELIDAKSIHLYQGHNNLGDYTAKCIYGTLNILCDDANCTMEIDAQQNYWGGSVSNNSLELQYKGAYTPDMPIVAIEVYTATAQGFCNQNNENGASMGCAVTFIDNEPEYNTACESVRPQVVISKRLNLEKPSGQAEKLTQTFLPHGQLKDAVVDMGNPILNTATFTNVPLDSALVYAAWHMQMYDSLANDSVAVALFHEILTSGLDRTNQGIRGRMEWGRYNMKTAMENLFYNNELAQTNNTASFETPVQQYVDVLNTMTDTLLTDSTYKEQFYLELDKGQLFRTLGNPLLARHIYRHLDDCDLDSVEQVQLNNWLAQVDLDISLNQQYIAQNTPPDSIVFAVDTAAYEAPIDYTTSNFYFGVWILSPSQVSFVNCGSNNVYRSMQQSSNDFDIYPNPTTGTFTMSVAQKANYTMSIVDLSGRVVHKCNMNLLENANTTITLASTIASGTYLAILEYDGGVLFNQLVVE